MRVLMLAQFYSPTVGGEERHVQDLSVALAERGHHVAVATLWHEGLPEFESERGVSIYRIKGTARRAAALFSESERRHAPPIPDPELVLGLRRIIAKEQPEIVHSHNWLGRSFLPLKRQSRAKLVVTLHDYSLVCAKKSMLRADAPCSGARFVKCVRCAAEHYGAGKGTSTVIGNWLMSGYERSLVDMFIPVSQAVADLVEIGKAQSRVIPNFVPDDFDSNGTSDDTPSTRLPDRPYLLYAGDLRLFKGIQVLLAAYAGIANAPPLVLIGRKDADTPTSFPDNVIVTGPLSHEQVLEAWRGSLMGLMPSIGPEAFGIAALEAMSAGRPVIASRIGGLPEIIRDGESGLLVPPGDHVALRRAIERLLADPALLARMGEAARRRAMEFRASVIVPQIEQAYKEVMESGK